MTNQKTLSSGAGRFDISTAGLHILAMTLMLMDHLWATLLPAQTCPPQTPVRVSVRSALQLRQAE